MMKHLFFGFFVLFTVFIYWAFRLPVGKKEAYRSYFVGTFYFKEGRIGNAVREFRQAYNAVPEEFNFALAFALALGREKRADEALDILQRGAMLLETDDPEWHKKIALRHFVTGMVYCYDDRYDRAIASLKEATTLPECPEREKLLSIFYNALGYANFLNQGKNAHRPSDRPSHYHVHRRDMLRSMEYFATALQLDGANESARQNYERLCDSLGLKPVPYSRRAAPGSAGNIDYNSSLPANIYQLLDLNGYDEVLFLLDISGSMVMEKVTCVDQDRFRVMKETARFFLDKIPEQTQLGIGTIGGDCGTTPKLWHPVGTLNRKDFRYALDFLVPDGTTPLLNILMDSPRLFSGSDSTRKAILLISDGANICRIGGLDICEWADNLRHQRISIQVLTFLNADLSNTNAFAEYTCLAENTYGEVIYVDANRCQVRPLTFNLVEQVPLLLPEIHRLDCWGPAVKDLWGIFLD